MLNCTECVVAALPPNPTAQEATSQMLGFVNASIHTYCGLGSSSWSTSTGTLLEYGNIATSYWESPILFFNMTLINHTIPYPTQLNPTGCTQYHSSTLTSTSTSTSTHVSSSTHSSTSTSSPSPSPSPWSTLPPNAVVQACASN
jgi:hypothetical protein